MTDETPHIIIVEDNPYDAQITVEAFQHCNQLLKAKVLVDGTQALEYIRTVCADARARSYLRLVLLDLKLPRMHGLDVLRRLRADEPTKDLPIVIFTSSLEENDRTASYNLGANDYVVKPVSFTEFMEAIGGVYKKWIEKE
jgi:two-component system, response regulator